MNEISVGDKVKQFERTWPYGAVERGGYIADHIGTVMKVSDHEQATYPVGVRFDEIDAPGALLWPFRTSELVVVERRSLYSKVRALEPGTIFKVGEGDPWIRTKRGVESLWGVVGGHSQFTNIEIPEGWKTYEITDVTVLWEMS